MKSISHTILTKCLDNDRAAQRLLYLHSKDYLMAIAYRYAQDMNKAKDILQNAYIKIYKNLDQFNLKKGSFKSWTARIVVNEALQIKRKRKELELTEDTQFVEAYTYIPAIDKLTVEELTRVIQALPEVHRVILNLFYFEEYTHQEIAETLNIKCSSSRAQLSKARKLLLKKWEEYNLTI